MAVRERISLIEWNRTTCRLCAQIIKRIFERPFSHDSYLMTHTASDRREIELWSVTFKKMIFAYMRAYDHEKIEMYLDSFSHHFENLHRYQKVQNKISHSLTQWPAHAKSKKIKNRFGHHFENQYIWLIIDCLSIPITVYYRFLNDNSGEWNGTLISVLRFLTVQFLWNTGKPDLLPDLARIT